MAKFGPGIWDAKELGSGINIPGPQHWWKCIIIPTFNKSDIVETGNNLHPRAVRLQLNFILKHLAHF
jgi:hypothetical protein